MTFCGVPIDSTDHRGLGMIERQPGDWSARVVGDDVLGVPELVGRLLSTAISCVVMVSSAPLNGGELGLHGSAVDWCRSRLPVNRWMKAAVPEDDADQQDHCHQRAEDDQELVLALLSRLQASDTGRPRRWPQGTHRTTTCRRDRAGRRCCRLRCHRCQSRKCRQIGLSCSSCVGSDGASA